MGEYSSNHSSPRPHLPTSSPSLLQQQQSATSSQGMQTPFQPFDPFNAAVTLDTNDTTDMDELSNLLSRQFLKDVDAETTLPTTSSPPPVAARLSPIGNTASTTSNNYYAPQAPSSNTPLANPWRVDESSSKKPWSPALETADLLSPPLFPPPPRQQDDARGSKAPTWDRFEPYRNDFEFDPTLQFYPDTPALITTTTKANVTPSSSMDDPTSTINQPIEADQQQQQQAPVNMTLNAALKKLSTLFKDRDEKELGQTLASFDYDVERTIEALLSSIETPSLSTPIAPVCPSPPPPPIVKTAITPSTAAAITTTPSTTSTTIGSPKKRQVCRHYLAGECYRKDCWFAHDLEVKPCKFWLQGLCLKGDTCEFAHSLEEIDQVVQYHHQPTNTFDNQAEQHHRHDQDH
ncbi:hypothetical protein [Absidia glauca]|uniref:C3H1-type domain-containing protein n=1 Tax=Absidia glauca TaxID=4829 RepID=A0A163TDC4_ABSGL|nr:hypothetical protein [Absidia glauca]